MQGKALWYVGPGRAELREEAVAAPKPGEVQVHLDDVRLGGVGTLREIPVIDVSYMQFYDPASASARWGLDHSHGAIYVSTRPR